MAAANAADFWSMCAAAGSQAVEGWRRGVGVVGGVGGGGGVGWLGGGSVDAGSLEPLKQCCNGTGARRTREGCGVGEGGGAGAVWGDRAWMRAFGALKQYGGGAVCLLSALDLRVVGSGHSVPHDISVPSSSHTAKCLHPTYVKHKLRSRAGEMVRGERRLLKAFFN